MKKLAVDWAELAMALDSSGWEMSYYLDIETGQVSTVTDEADLTPLATLGRKLGGHAQSFGRSGEVFLADEQHHYLGRTCSWKQCGPGIRASCDALHCGQRPYLHDDLGEINLSKVLITEPPIELWPEVVARVPLPDDVMERVIRPLQL